jgi:hypothetical protein
MKTCITFSSACMTYKKKGLGISIVRPKMAISELIKIILQILWMV